MSSNMRAVTDFLGEIGEQFPDELEGKSTFGGFDGPPLDPTRQYRAEIARGEWRQSRAGNWQFAFTFEVIEDLKDEFVGRKFTEYFTIDKGAKDGAKQAFARFIGESGLNVADLDQSSNENFAKEFEGCRYVIATRVWGEEQDQTGIRYLNRDRGQELKDNVKPPVNRGPGGSSKPLNPEINVNKDRGPFPEAPTEAEEAPAQDNDLAAATSTEQKVNLPGSGTRPVGVNLPPGLQR